MCYFFAFLHRHLRKLTHKRGKKQLHGISFSLTTGNSNLTARKKDNGQDTNSLVPNDGIMFCFALVLVSSLTHNRAVGERHGVEEIMDRKGTEERRCSNK